MLCRIRQDARQIVPSKSPFRLQNSRFSSLFGAKRRERDPRVWTREKLFFFSVSTHSPSPFLHSLQAFRSNWLRRSRSQKIRLFCSLPRSCTRHLSRTTPACGIWTRATALKSSPIYWIYYLHDECRYHVRPSSLTKFGMFKGKRNTWLLNRASTKQRHNWAFPLQPLWK